MAPNRYLFRFKQGDAMLDLNDGTAYTVPDVSRIRIAKSDNAIVVSVPVRIMAEKGEVSALHRRKRTILDWLNKAQDWSEKRRKAPVDLLAKVGDALGGIEPVYGRGHLYFRVLSGSIEPDTLVPPRVQAESGLWDNVVITMRCRPFYHGMKMLAADATGSVEEVAGKGLEIWEGTTNLFVNPCLAYPTDWDQRWAVYNSTDLALSQSTSIWRSLGSAAKLRAGTKDGVFYDDIALTNAAHVLSAYVNKEGATPTTADCELWAGWVFDNFSSGAAPAAPLASFYGGGGTVTVANGVCTLDSSGALADYAVLYYNAMLNANKIFRIMTRWTATSISGVYIASHLGDKATAPSLNVLGTETIRISQESSSAVRIRYTDSAATLQYWNGTAWTTAVSDAISAAIGDTLRADIVSNGTSWYVVIYDANDTALTTTSPVAWANTRAIASGLWWAAGDHLNGAWSIDVDIDYVKIDVGALTTTFESEDSEHPDWYRMTAAAFTMPSTDVKCGVLVKAGRYVYVDDLQCEAKLYATPFANGDFLGCAWSGTAHDSTTTRTAGQVKLNNRYIYADHGSITLWYKAGLGATAAPNFYLLDIRGANDSNRLALYYTSTNDKFNLYLNGAVRCQSAAQTFAAGDITFLAITWDFTSDSYVLYIGTSDSDTDATALTAPDFGASDLYIGSNYSAVAQMNGAMYDLRVWDTALDADQIAALCAQGRGRGGLTAFWTPAGDGKTFNFEDNTHQGDGVLLCVPGDARAGMRMWVDPDPDDTAITENQYKEMWIALYPLQNGAYQAKGNYYFEGESLGGGAAEEVAFDYAGGGATLSDVASVKASNGTYRKVIKDGTVDLMNYVNLSRLMQQFWKQQGRWRMFARAVQSGSAGDWSIQLSGVALQNGALAYSRRYDLLSIPSGSFGPVGYINCGLLDIPPLAGSEGLIDVAFAAPYNPGVDDDYMFLYFHTIKNVVAVGSELYVDAMEMLPADELAWLRGLTTEAHPLLIDSCDDRPVAYSVHEMLGYKAAEHFDYDGAALRPTPTAPSRVFIRKTLEHKIYVASATPVYAKTLARIEIEPRFEALP